MVAGYTTSYSSVANAPAEVRVDFIRRVYTLFFLSVLVTIGVGAFCAQPALLPTMLSLRPVLMIAGLVCFIGMFFARRTTGLNIALLYLFAAIEGALLGPLMPLINQVAPGVPAQAAWLTGGVFAGLTAYVFQSRKDFSYLGGMLFGALIALLIAGILLFFIGSTLLHTLYCVAGVLIFCGYILYDTSQIIQHLAPDEAIVGAVELYLDILNLFLFILRLLMIFNSRDD
jgi:FtsH-binding integral membrane protein